MSCAIAHGDRIPDHTGRAFIYAILFRGPGLFGLKMVAVYENNNEVNSLPIIQARCS